MKRVAEEIMQAAKEIVPLAVITVPRVEGVDGWVYNEVHAEASRFIDRIRRNEHLATFIERQDADDSMVLKIGFTDHDASDAIVREVVGKVSKVCAKYGIKTIKAAVEDEMKPMLDRAFEAVRIAKQIMAEDTLNAKIWAALEEMGAVPSGPVAGPIRWQAVFFIGPAGSGKSFIRNMRYMRHLDFKVVDPDEVKKKHPDYDPDNPFKVHAWSKEVSNAQFKKIVESGNGDPVIVDGTGRNTEGILKKMKMAADNGYRTYLVYVYVPFEISIFRNRNRSRFVPEDVIMEQSGRILKNFKTLKSRADKSKVISNYENAELGKAKEDIKLYPVPQPSRPPRPGDPDYGMAKAASELVTLVRSLREV